MADQPAVTGTVPRATYRLQVNARFTLDQVAAVVPYLDELGVSHCYMSPLLKARPGSAHGYDIVDHNAINPELGGLTDFERLSASLQARAMGAILDIVPNHMGVGGDDNQWWLDMLENGQSSPYADYFDVDWQPINEVLRGKVMVPLLGDYYGRVLNSGQLRLAFDAANGAFSVRYFGHRFPIDPKTYDSLLHPAVNRLSEVQGLEPGTLPELRAIADELDSLPAHHERRASMQVQRRHAAAVLKGRLAALCGRSRAVTAAIEAEVAACNGDPGRPESFDCLHLLLEQQAYRLAYWQVASDEINYRRFFDINDLAGLRMENVQVFEDSHRLILDLIARRRIDGLRIDHPDGLYDPGAYYQRLGAAVRASLGVDPAPPEADQTPPLYTVVEKILAPYEHPPRDWPVHGTTGYDFANLVTGLLVRPDSERAFERLYRRFTGIYTEPDQVLYQCKKLIMKTQLSSELTVLANQLRAIAEADRSTRDYTLNGLRDALSEITASFPVYRTYVTVAGPQEQDREFVDWAIAQAKKRSAASDLGIYDFIRALLLLSGAPDWPPAYRDQAVAFALRFQQYTAPVMAKSLEDTFSYIYNRFVPLNEVGGDPRRFGLSVAAFHHANRERLRFWPHAMLAASTHDSKRSEDVRCRLAALSEIPDAWRHRVMRWCRINRNRKTKYGSLVAPDRNDEYLFYQTLLGVWPLEEVDEEGLAALRGRIQAYMLKAVREAKVHTSWLRPEPEYEEATARFIDGVLGTVRNNKFLDDFLPFQQQLARWGLFNSLTATLLRLTAPGVPDIYQGDELWNFNLVDPDNRRAVDFDRRHTLLAGLKGEFEAAGARGRATLARSLVADLQDGRAKLHLVWRALALRRSHPELFAAGDYLPLDVQGGGQDHLCAFARSTAGRRLVVAAPFRYAALDRGWAPLGADAWGDTRIVLPGEWGAVCLENVLTGETVDVQVQDNGVMLEAAAALRNFPVALFSTED